MYDECPFCLFFFFVLISPFFVVGSFYFLLRGNVEILAI